MKPNSPDRRTKTAPSSTISRAPSLIIPSLALPTRCPLFPSIAAEMACSCETDCPAYLPDWQLPAASGDQLALLDHLGTAEQRRYSRFVWFDRMISSVTLRLAFNLRMMTSNRTGEEAPDDDAARARALRQQVRSLARQGAMDPGDGMGL
jgi:hypothetical protein